MKNHDTIKEFENSVEDFILREGLLHHDAPVIVGVSGGADSVALLFTLQSLKYDVRVAHCNFHLRGEESMRDVRLVSELSRSMGVDLYVRDFDVAKRMQLTGESVEMACRELRYRWFGELLDRERAQALAVGHHREDRAETVLINLMRGTGPAGIAGMKPRNPSGPGGTVVVRPLIEKTRLEIEDYLNAKGGAWVMDSTNLADEYVRNRVRHHVLPSMSLVFPGALDGIIKTSVQTAETWSFYSYLKNKFFEQFHKGDKIDLKSLVAISGAHARIAFREILSEYGFSMSQIEDILAGVKENASGLEFRGKNSFGELSRGILTLGEEVAVRQTGSIFRIDLRKDIFEPMEIKVSLKDVRQFVDEPKTRNAGIAFIDADAAYSGVWEMRPWRRGDRLQPFGMKGQKLVSDIFSDAKLDASQKRAAWIVTRNGKIVWIPGLKNSALHAIGPGTKKYVKLEIK